MTSGVLTDGVVSTDFTTSILGSSGVDVEYYVMTKTADPTTGSETTIFAAHTHITAIFFLEQNRYIWDKEGLLLVGDAYLIVPTTQSAKRYDKIKFPATTGSEFYIENVRRRYVNGVAMADYCTLFRTTT